MADFDKLVDTHWHTYPKTPKMNAHCERFNRTIQDELINNNIYDLENTDEFNHKMNENKYKKKCNMLWTYTVL